MHRLLLDFPLIQAPMAGVSTPALAAAVSNAGALGSISVGAVDAVRAKQLIRALRGSTDRPFNVNVFTHQTPRSDPRREARWLECLRPQFRNFDATPPTTLQPIYKSFNDDAEMLDALLESAPPGISFHFGLPTVDRVAALKASGALLLTSVTNVTEALAAKQVGMDGVIAQGFEAGGHRGVFDPSAVDARLGTATLTGELVRELGLPVIAAGGIMDGAGIAAAVGSGAFAAQLGTAFILCPESSADAAYRSALLEGSETVMTTAISGRPARCLVNRFTRLGAELGDVPRPDYPIAYDAGKALHAAASGKQEFGYGAQWAGTGVRHVRSMFARELPARELVEKLEAEFRRSRA